METRLWVVLLVCLIALRASAFNGDDELFIGENDEIDHCTAITVGPKASKDGSTMTTHTNDCHQCDHRVFRIPAQDHNDGDVRPVYMAEHMEYPRYVGYSRGVGYHPVGDQKPEEAIGSIPQVPHTYAYFDGSYGIMNEHQVAIGESTCSAKISAKPLKFGGSALFDAIELSKVALERSKTAREAIQTMGSLAEQYGFYTEWRPEASVPMMAGETLTVIDPKESWVFHILASPCGKSAVWAAKRVPDDEVSVVANFFTINELDLSKPDWYMASSNIFQVAQDMGFWDPAKEPFSFVKAYAYDMPTLKDYFVVRMWRIFDLMAPSLKLDWNVSGVLDLPFSVKPERLLTPQDIMRFNRDLHEGTDLDLTRGAAAGPFGSPMRQDGMSQSARDLKLKGEWARAVSLMRTAYSTVLQTRSWLPAPIGGIFWFGEDAPHATVFFPLYAGMMDTPKSIRTGSLLNYTRESAWWAFDFVANWAEYKWKYIMQDVRAKQAEIESAEFKQIPEVDAMALDLYYNQSEAKAIQYLTDYCIKNAESLVQTWWNFSDYLIAKYNDGYVNFPKVGGMAGYPAWWLKSVGYDMDPRYKEFVRADLVASPNYNVTQTVKVYHSLDEIFGSGLNVSYTTFFVSMAVLLATSLLTGYGFSRLNNKVSD